MKARENINKGPRFLSVVPGILSYTEWEGAQARTSGNKEAAEREAEKFQNRWRSRVFVSSTLVPTSKCTPIGPDDERANGQAAVDVRSRTFRVSILPSLPT